MPLILTGTSSSATLDSSAGLTFSDSSNQSAAASPFGLKNRIINGDMRIDQRNAGASVTQTTADLYPVDRFRILGSVTSKFTGQRSNTAPTGFTNSLLLTSSAATSLAAGDFYICTQKIEGFNIADLAWGTASAATVTLSFWTRSSLTGTFGGALLNDAANRSYPFTYTISLANTWEYKTVTIAGDTTGTWLTTNSTGMFVNFGLGVGTTYSGTAGAWAGAFYFSATGATSVVGTSGATFYITGVQLEQNTSATPFERRLYGQELVNCQRYYWQGGNGAAGIFNGPGTARYSVILPTTMRTTPTTTAIAAPIVINPTVAEQQTGSQTTNFGVTGYGASVNYSVAQIQFGGFSSGADGRTTTLLNTALQFSAEL